jgi:transcriptional regulator with XRE-family HTH domain
MTISERIREIREFRGLKQISVASQMNVSQQAYSVLEQKSANYRIDTLRKFCSAVNIDLPFLLSLELPISDENMKLFDLHNTSQVVDEYKKLKAKTAFYEEILIKRVEPHSAAV